MTRRITFIAALSAFLLAVRAPGGAAGQSATQSAPASMSADAEHARKSWNKLFGDPKIRYRADPNEFLQRCLERLGAGKGRAALDVAMGQGRNAVLLAGNGWDTTGIDISDVAVDLARKNAEKAGVKFKAVQGDVFTYDYGDQKWDLIAVIYFNPGKPLIDTLKRAVKPGGVVIIEGYGSRKVGGPPDDTKFGANDLIGRFYDWQILEYQDGDFIADWAGGDSKQHVVRIMARRMDRPLGSQ